MTAVLLSAHATAFLISAATLLATIIAAVVALLIMRHRAEHGSGSRDQEAAGVVVDRSGSCGDCSVTVSNIEVLVLDETMQVSNFGDTSIRIEGFGADCCALLYTNDEWSRKFDPRSTCTILLHALYTKAMTEELMFEVRVSGTELSVRPGQQNLRLHYTMFKMKVSLYLGTEHVIQQRIFNGQLLKTVHFNRNPCRYYKICTRTRLTAAAAAAAMAAAAATDAVSASVSQTAAGAAVTAAGERGRMRNSIISGSNIGSSGVNLDAAAAAAAAAAARSSIISLADDNDAALAAAAVAATRKQSQQLELQLQLQESQMLPLLSMRVEPNAAAAVNATNRPIRAIVQQSQLKLDQLTRLLMTNMIDMPCIGTFNYEIKLNNAIEYKELVRLRLTELKISIEPPKRSATRPLYCEIDLIGRRDQPVAKRRIVSAEVLSELQLPRKRYSYLLTFSVPVLDLDFNPSDIMQRQLQQQQEQEAESSCSIE